MRNPERIGRICRKLEELWNKYPDQRFGQLIENFVCYPEVLFFQEDDRTESNLDATLGYLHLDEEEIYSEVRG